MINALIHYVADQGWGLMLNRIILIANFIVQLIFLIYYRTKYDISVKQVCLIEMIVYPASLLTMYVLAWFENGSWGGFNIVRIFVYIPLYALLTEKIIGVPFGKFVDYLAPSIIINKMVGHLACPFTGCCHGYACSWGIWNPAIDALVFPNQWLECVVSACILAILLYNAKKTQYSGTGTIYASMLCIYGTARFFMEFLRDNDKLVGNISNLAFHALFMVVVGAIWLFVHAEKESEDKRKAARKQQKR